MSTRRDFVKFIAAAGLFGPAGARATPASGPAAEADADDRAYWLQLVRRLATPVLEAGAAAQLPQRLPMAAGTGRRSPYAALEAAARLLDGIAPWLESDAPVAPDEAALRERYRDLAGRTIAALVDPRSPGRVDFAAGEQSTVEAGFLAEALVRAPRRLWGRLEPETRTHVVAAFRETRRHPPGFHNHLLFAAMIEAFFARIGAPWDAMRVDYALRQFEEWYRGDGFYSDGPEFHFDYYNSIVIHPMLLDVLAAIGDGRAAGAGRDSWAALGYPARMLARAQRCAAVHERLISPEGALPPVGRSLSYRSGLLHGLAQIALLEKLPEPIQPAQVRGALAAAMRRLLGAPDTFDEAGWLRIGFAGAQPALGEPYISTGSLYLCAVSLLPLGLPPENPFWAGPAVPWTARQIYAGENAPRDAAFKSA